MFEPVTAPCIDCLFKDAHTCPVLQAIAFCRKILRMHYKHLFWNIVPFRSIVVVLLQNSSLCSAFLDCLVIRQGI